MNGKEQFFKVKDFLVDKALLFLITSYLVTKALHAQHTDLQLQQPPSISSTGDFNRKIEINEFWQKITLFGVAISGAGTLLSIRSALRET